jgi:hypothetical protein
MNGDMVVKKLDDLMGKKFNKSITIMSVFVYVICTVIIYCYRDRFFNHFDPRDGFAIAVAGVLVCLSAILFTFYFVGSYTRKVMRQKRTQFRSTFKEGPPTSWKEIGLMQEYIDGSLCLLASAFRDACKTERLFLKVTAPTELEGVVEARKKLGKLHSDIRARENVFWEAWGLAQLFGFEVLESVKDYWAKG